MNTVLFPCGCSVSRSMFGDHEIMSVIPCYEHALSLQDNLDELAKALFNLQSSVGETNDTNSA